MNTADSIEVELTSNLNETLKLLINENGQKSLENEIEEVVHNKIRELYRENENQEKHTVNVNREQHRDAGPKEHRGPGTGRQTRMHGPGAMAGMGAAGMGAGPGAGMQDMMEEMMAGGTQGPPGPEESSDKSRSEQEKSDNKKRS